MPGGSSASPPGPRRSGSGARSRPCGSSPSRSGRRSRIASVTCGASYLRASNGQLWGRPANGIESRYLLTGLAAVRSMRGSLIVHSRAVSGPAEPRPTSAPTTTSGGRRSVPEALVPRWTRHNEASSKAFEQEILNPEVVGARWGRVLAQLHAPTDTVVPRRTGAPGRTPAVRPGGRPAHRPRVAGVLISRPPPRRHSGPRAAEADAPGRAGGASTASGPSAPGTCKTSSVRWRYDSRTGADSSGARLPRAARSSGSSWSGGSSSDGARTGSTSSAGQASPGSDSGRNPSVQRRAWLQRDSNPCFSLERAGHIARRKPDTPSRRSTQC